MITYAFDAGGKIDAGAFVTMRTKGDFKAPVPQNIEMELVEAKLIEPKTMPKDWSEIIGYHILEEDVGHDTDAEKEFHKFSY